MNSVSTDQYVKSTIEDDVRIDVEEYKEKDHGKWQMIPVSGITKEETLLTIHRLNALGSLYYHTKVILRNHRLVEHLHLDMCLNFEKHHLKEIIEIPRDHFKSTIGSEGAPTWWGLPFSPRDEQFMRSIGYGDEWIEWMKRAHNQNTRTLLVSENITNAAKLGVRVDGHYANNSFFRACFKEIVPDTSCTWTQFSKTHKRNNKSKPHGEGTFDYIGVGGALQSRHYDRVIQDDLVGKAASESQTVMQKTIDYHKLLVGAFDSDRAVKLDNDEIVIGNRWSYNDLNSYLREEETYFNITNHSALGGCCSKHPAGVPIFPEEFTVEKLSRFAKRLGPYLFSCQFLNTPVPPKDSPFDPKYLRYFQWTKLEDEDDKVLRTFVRHEADKGEIIPSIAVNRLRISMVVDPNHAGEEGRCNHAIVVVGYHPGIKQDKTDERIYLLACWAESANFDVFISKIYELAEIFKLNEFWLETIAAQQYLKYHLEYRNRIEKRRLKVRELKTPKSRDAKNQRILALGPTFENRQFWCLRSQVDFIKQYSLFPNLNIKDILDVLGYALQVWTQGSSLHEYRDYFENYTPAMGQGQCGY